MAQERRLGFVIGAATLLLVHGNAAAQRASSATAPLGRLTVRPQEIATGRQTTAQAEQPDLDSLNDKIYVPEQCVSPRQCPLVVALSGWTEDPPVVIAAHREFADKYGIILFAPAMAAPEHVWDVQKALRASRHGPVPRGLQEAVSIGAFDNIDVRNIDAALEQVLRNFAIDPNRIGLMGYSYGASYALFLARHNLDIFSRVAVLSPTSNWGGTGPQNTATQFFISAGTQEADEIVQVTLRVAQELRQTGYPLKASLVQRGHVRNPQEDPLVWQWFSESWASPDLTAPVAGNVMADSVPILTMDALARLTLFWQACDTVNLARLAQDSLPVLRAITSTLEDVRAHELPVVIGQQLVRIGGGGDMVAAAAQPWIRATLHRVGLTAQQESAYRAAVIGAVATRKWGLVSGPMVGNSVVGNNIAFIRQHPAEVMALGRLLPVLKDIQ